MNQLANYVQHNRNRIGLNGNSVSAHHSIELLLNLNY